ncbi:glycosyl transferase family 2 [Paramesorhizobium deserti]|uniref:Glycosyl transferase family 2 n=1 Tax=Paramesorhizobium deserti TaxID=1494590 RepID=A0A135HYZ7_9HYPH|nr:glycosyltransferase [Paramesorhizobium deserti]KXF78417.1 glycosyl transferase family 2 [Paramesorhizobium deserti]
MVSVIIETKNAEEALARTLAGLVNAAVEGLVRDVVIVDHGSSDHTREVADAAGCSFLENGSLLDGVRLARGEWLLLLEPGSRLLEGWSESARNHIEALPGPARFSRSSINRPRFLARVFGTNNPMSDGLLMSKRQAMALLKPGHGAGDLARGIATRRLKAEIVPANRA